MVKKNDRLIQFENLGTSPSDLGRRFDLRIEVPSQSVSTPSKSKNLMGSALFSLIGFSNTMVALNNLSSPKSRGRKPSFVVNKGPNPELYSYPRSVYGSSYIDVGDTASGLEYF